MAIPIPSRRHQFRFALTGQFADHWTTRENQVIDILPLDVSSRGFGLLLNPAPAVGSQIIWHCPQLKEAIENPLVFAIVWSASPTVSHDFSEMTNMRRCGLLLVSDDQTIDLVELCAKIPSLQMIE